MEVQWFATETPATTSFLPSGQETFMDGGGTCRVGTCDLVVHEACIVVRVSPYLSSSNGS